MMKGILGMISSCDDYYGFNKDDNLKALNIEQMNFLADEMRELIIKKVNTMLLKILILLLNLVY